MLHLASCTNNNTYIEILNVFIGVFKPPNTNFLGSFQNMAFGENLREALELINMQQTELAQKTKINLRNIQKYVQKDGAIPAADTAVKIAQALGVTVEYLVTGKDHSKNNFNSLEPEIQKLIRSIKNLPKDKRKKVTKIALYLTEIL